MTETIKGKNPRDKTRRTIRDAVNAFLKHPLSEHPLIVGAITGCLGIVIFTISDGWKYSHEEPMLTVNEGSLFITEYWEDTVDDERCCWDRHSPPRKNDKEADKVSEDAYYAFVSHIDKAEVADVVQMEGNDKKFTADVTLHFDMGFSRQSDIDYLLACPEKKFFFYRSPCARENIRIEKMKVP